MQDSELGVRGALTRFPLTRSSLTSNIQIQVNKTFSFPSTRLGITLIEKKTFNLVIFGAPLLKL